MKGTIIIVLMLVLVVIVLAVVFAQSGLWNKVKAGGENIASKVNPPEPEIADGPSVYYRRPGSKNYVEVKMTKKKFTIGTAADNDLVLNDPKVESHHAYILKAAKNDRVFFKFVNTAKTNPSNYFNQQKNVYEFLGINDPVELGSREAFYVGDTKIITAMKRDHYAATTGVKTSNVPNEEKREKTAPKREPMAAPSVEPELPVYQRRVSKAIKVSPNEMDYDDFDNI